MKQFQLEFDEAGAIAYWTLSGKAMLGITEEESLYKLLNYTLITRDQTILQNWQPYLYFLMQGLNKLPPFRGTVYRGLKGRLTKMSNQYVVGNEIVWIAVTSTSKRQTVTKAFFTGTGEATWLMIHVKDGKDIKDLSLIPNEDEVLLPPNTRVKVLEIISANAKIMMGLPDNVDGIVLQQL